MKIKAIIYGASGMVGKGVLLECLESPDVESVLLIGRSACGITHPKIKEILHRDFNDYSGIEEQLKGYDTCYFCLGVSAFRMSEEDYSRITYDFTLSAAQTLVRLNPDMTFCYVSGTGTDSSEKGRIMWARVKGKTENDLLKLPFKKAIMFRPGFIQPMKGITSRTKLYRLTYTVFGFLYPLLNALFPNQITNTTKVGQAMINAVIRGTDHTYLENRQINQLANLSL